MDNPQSRKSVSFSSFALGPDLRDEPIGPRRQYSRTALAVNTNKLGIFVADEIHSTFCRLNETFVKNLLTIS